MLGTPLGYFGVRALIAINSGHIPRIDLQGTAVVFDARVFTFALLASLFSAILFGLLPALYPSGLTPVRL